MRRHDEIVRLLAGLDRPWLGGELEAATRLLAFAESYGYGNAMQLLSQVWQQDDPHGALTVGPAAGHLGLPAVLLWRFAEAPAAYRALSTAGGDEDWLLFCPTALVDTAWPPFLSWLGYLLPEGAPGWEDSRSRIERHAVEGGVVLIFSHS
jgi:hypothetical protein